MIPVVVGSNPIGHPSFAPLFSAALAQVEVNARGVARSGDPEFLHQLRVGLRRLRTVQRAFRIPGTKRRLRKFKPALAAARDWDVFLANRALPREIAPAAQRKRAAAWRRARSVLASRAFDEFLPIDAPRHFEPLAMKCLEGPQG